MWAKTWSGSVHEAQQLVHSQRQDAEHQVAQYLAVLETSISPANTTFVQHNLDLSGGTSGSPIIDHNGWVIAVNNSGTEKLVFDVNTGQPERVPTGNIGFGIRVDEVWSMIDWLEASGSSRGRSRVGTTGRHSLAPYRAFPENWNGRTTAPEVGQQAPGHITPAEPPVR